MGLGAVHKKFPWLFDSCIMSSVICRIIVGVMTSVSCFQRCLFVPGRVTRPDDRMSTAMCDMMRGQVHCNVRDVNVKRQNWLVRWLTQCYDINTWLLGSLTSSLLSRSSSIASQDSWRFKQWTNTDRTSKSRNIPKMAVDLNSLCDFIHAKWTWDLELHTGHLWNDVH